MKIKCVLLLFVVSFSNYLMGLENHINLIEQAPKDFLLFSVPKSGTHLMFKCLKILIDFSPVDWSKEPFWDDFPDHESFAANLLRWKKNNCFLSSHPCSLYDGDQVVKFSIENKNYQKILIVRDLRDAIISFAYGFLEECQDEAGVDLKDFDSRLDYVLMSLPDSYANYFLEESIQGAIELAKQENVFVIHFEDLIGEKGGGNDENQREVIKNLCTILGIIETSDLFEKVKDELFGNHKGPNVSVTFRNGQVGVWKEYFKPHHLQLFYDKWGNYQQALGYSLE
ncbi:MAG: sulfotransferase domain-containing protein [Parachlamydiaceae bacterium]|nr:sulfotransferase domain-containing protein [Parachlamydiaceae bacterium]